MTAILKKTAFTLSGLFGLEPKTWSAATNLCARLLDHDIPATIGKFSKKGDDPDQIVFEYQQCSTHMASDKATHDYYLSLKPPALQFDARKAVRIAQVALANGHGIHFDSHGHGHTDPSLKMMKNLIDRLGYDTDRTAQWHYGLTLPARWKRSLSDARWAADHQIRVRIVKGEFKADRSWDEMDPQEGFIQLIDHLIGTIHPIALATHDDQLSKKAINRARKNGNDVELELLFGFPATQMICLSCEMDVPIRFYVAYGETLFLYAIWQLITHPGKWLNPHILEVFGSEQAKLTKILSSFVS